MERLTFGEQVKIILGRKGMTIKELAEQIEVRTGRNMSRQNMTQRLKRDNFQEQDMRMIAEILGCQLHLQLLEDDSVKSEERENTPKRETAVEREVVPEPAPAPEREVIPERKIEPAPEREVTVGELLMPEEDYKKPTPTTTKERLSAVTRTVHKIPLQGSKERRTIEVREVKEVMPGEINPYTGREYQTNSVRVHPKRIGYVQVYDREKHGWTDMTEWAFLGFQERKKKLLGKDYDPPIYLD